MFIFKNVNGNKLFPTKWLVYANMTVILSYRENGFFIRK